MAKKRVEWDGTPESIEKLKAENAGLLLIGIQNHTDGNALVFAAPEDIEPPVVPVPPSPSPEERIAALEARVAALEKKP